MIHEVLGIDTGEKETGWARVQVDGDRVKVASGVSENDVMLIYLRHANCPVAFERVENTRFGGKAIGTSIMWLGRFYEAASAAKAMTSLVHRNSVLSHFATRYCRKPNGDRMGNDAALRQRLIERYGKELTPKSSHERSAMAVALVVLAEMTEDSQ